MRKKRKTKAPSRTTKLLQITTHISHKIAGTVAEKSEDKSTDTDDAGMHNGFFSHKSNEQLMTLLPATVNAALLIVNVPLTNVRL